MAEPIYETRDEKMVSHKDGKITVRIARFLNPISRTIKEAVPIPKNPLLSELLPQSSQQWPSKVLFRDWKYPQKNWKDWAHRLNSKYGSIWNQTGISDAIITSTYELRCNQDVILGLSEFWCSRTNTFVFPWGEATVTLEDVMVLGGFPLLGQTVTSTNLTREMLKIKEALERHRTEISRGKARKADNSVWLKYFMEQEREYEHAAFLSLWLSRYVFSPSTEGTIAKNVFPIAAKLSLGVKVSLAPAVLASVYQNLRNLIKQYKATPFSDNKMIVLGQFQLLQIWAFERFPVVGANPSNSLQPGEPRVALWHKMNLKLNLPLARLVLRLAENFQWRPYVGNLENRHYPLCYKETEQVVFDCSKVDNDGLRSFLKCLRACELVGLDCKENYLPHRVAMQFGMDQDLPADLSKLDLTRKCVKFFVPSRSFQPGVSARYSNWWKDLMGTREDAIKDDALLWKRNLQKSESLLGQGNGNEEGYRNVVGVDRAKDPKEFNNEGKRSPNILQISSKARKKIIREWSDDDDDDDKFKPTPVVQVNNSRRLANKLKLKSLALKRTKKSLEALKKSSCEERDDSTSMLPAMNKNWNEYSSDDDMQRRLVFPKVALSTPTVVNGSSKKRKVSSCGQGNLQEKVPIHCAKGVGIQVKVKGVKSSKWNSYVREEGRKAGSSFCDKTKPKVGIGSYKSEQTVSSKVTPQSGEVRMDGNSLNDPTEKIGSRSPKHSQGLESRVKKLEKLMEEFLD